MYFQSNLLLLTQLTTKILGGWNTIWWSLIQNGEFIGNLTVWILWGNKKVYLHFLSFTHAEVVKIVKFQEEDKLLYLYKYGTIPVFGFWLLMMRSSYLYKGNFHNCKDGLHIKRRPVYHAQATYKILRMMHVLKWRTISAPTRVLCWRLFPQLRSNEANKHQNNTRVSA